MNKKSFDSLEAMSSSAISAAFNMKSPVIIALTERGRGTRYISKYKPSTRVIALCRYTKVATQCRLQRSIFPLVREDANLENSIKELIEEMKNIKMLQPKQNIIIYSGIKDDITGTENTIKAILIK